MCEHGGVDPRERRDCVLARFVSFHDVTVSAPLREGEREVSSRSRVRLPSESCPDLTFFLASRAMGKPRLPTAPKQVPDDVREERQRKDIERLYSLIEESGHDREWIDRVIEICRWGRDDAGLPEGTRKRAAARANALAEAVKYNEHVHALLHIASDGFLCDLKERKVCASLHPTQVEHFRSCKRIVGDLALARLRGHSLKSRSTFFDAVPPEARTRGGAANYLHEKFSLRHRDIALLVESPNGLPVAESVLKARAGAIKTACYEVRRAAR